MTGLRKWALRDATGDVAGVVCRVCIVASVTMLQHSAQDKNLIPHWNFASARINLGLQGN